MDQIKSSPEPLVNAMVIKYSMARLPNWFTTMVFNWFSRKCSMVLSNVPGPQKHLSIGGKVITDLMFWPPQRANVGKSSHCYYIFAHAQANFTILKCFHFVLNGSHLQLAIQCKQQE